MDKKRTHNTSGDIAWARVDIAPSGHINHSTWSPNRTDIDEVLRKDKIQTPTKQFNIKKPKPSFMKKTLINVLYVGVIVLAFKIVLILVKYIPLIIESYLK